MISRQKLGEMWQVTVFFKLWVLSRWNLNHKWLSSNHKSQKWCFILDIFRSFDDLNVPTSKSPWISCHQFTVTGCSQGSHARGQGPEQRVTKAQQKSVHFSIETFPRSTWFPDMIIFRNWCFLAANSTALRPSLSVKLRIPRVSSHSAPGIDLDRAWGSCSSKLLRFGSKTTLNWAKVVPQRSLTFCRMASHLLFYCRRHGMVLRFDYLRVFDPRET